MKDNFWLRSGGLAAVLWAMLGTGSCAPDVICFNDNTTLVSIDFRKELFPGTDSASFESDTLIIIQVGAIGTDSVFFESDTLTSVVVPVNTSAETTVFIFDSDQGQDTLELRYRRQQQLLSVDCGPEQAIDNLELVQSTFDSVAIVSPILNTQVSINVEIYN